MELQGQKLAETSVQNVLLVTLFFGQSGAKVRHACFAAGKFFCANFAMQSGPKDSMSDVQAWKRCHCGSTLVIGEVTKECKNMQVNSKSSARKGMWHTDTSHHKFQQSFPQALHHGSGAGWDDHYHLSGETMCTWVWRLCQSLQVEEEWAVKQLKPSALLEIRPQNFQALKVWRRQGNLPIKRLHDRFRSRLLTCLLSWAGQDEDGYFMIFQ